MPQDLTIIGPNIDPHMVGRHGETFHVHATGCADVARYGGTVDQRGRAWTFSPPSFAELARHIYDDQIEEGSMTVDDAMADIWLAPCVLHI